MNSQAALSELPDTPLATPVLARQAIVAHDLSIYGYELIQRSETSATSDSDAESLLYLLTMGAGKAFAERRMLFVHCTLQTLESAPLDLLDPERVVLAVALPAATDAARIRESTPRLIATRERGFRLAFNHEVLAPVWDSWREHASFVRMDLPRLRAGAAPLLVQHARRQRGLQLIACGVDSTAQHDAAISLGMQLFQGGWFARPVTMKNSVIRPALANILLLINLVRAERPIAEIEVVLKRDPALSFNLLRFINCSGFNLSCEVSSFRHAVMILGLKKMFRWATLLLATARAGAPPSVMHTAIVRGRLMELLAAEVTPEDCDNAFVAGVFSMLDAMTGMPIATALEGLALPEVVVEALLHRTGSLAPFLDLAQACECEEAGAFLRAATRLQLSGRQVNMAHLHALSWAADLLE